ncbi:ArsR/SmtB family transcription factor [Motiliproteus sp.]|uniref:ArsR/SmtB family transcription factor n=1 Tax=Motiliproteus sp. TaxID=1898955 RepID=UPI003BAB6A70
MEIETAAKRLAELGHKTRLEIFRYLIRGGHQGVPVGEIQAALGVPGSTLSHHLNRLMSVGLVAQRREGRTLYCTSQYQELDELLAFLKDECCINGLSANEWPEGETANAKANTKA